MTQLCIVQVRCQNQVPNLPVAIGLPTTTDMEGVPFGSEGEQAIQERGVGEGPR